MGVVGVAVSCCCTSPRGIRPRSSPGTTRGRRTSPRIRHQLGLDRPVHIQFFTWVGSILSGDLGVSIFSDLPVAHLIGAALGADLRPRRGDPRLLRRHRRPDGRPRRLEGGDLDGPHHHDLRRARFLGAGVRDRLRAHVGVLAQARLVPGAGLQVDLRRARAVPALDRPADRRPRGHLRGPDGPDHPREHARDSPGGLHPHRAGEGSRQPFGPHPARGSATRRSPS